MIDFGGVSTFLEGCVVQLAQNDKPGFKEGDDFRRRLQFVLICFHRVSERCGSIPKIRVTKNSAFHLRPSLAAVGGVFPARKINEKRQAPDLPYGVDSIMRPARPRTKPDAIIRLPFSYRYCGSLSFGGVESGAASVVVSRPWAAARKSRTVG